MKLETAKKITVATNDSTDIIISELPVTGTLSVTCVPADRVYAAEPVYQQVGPDSYNATITVTGGSVAASVAVTITLPGDVLESVVVTVVVEPVESVTVLDESGEAPGQWGVYPRQRIITQNQANILTAVNHVNSKINYVMGEVALIGGLSTLITEATVLRINSRLKALQKYLSDVIIVASKDEVDFNRK